MGIFHGKFQKNLSVKNNEEKKNKLRVLTVLNILVAAADSTFFFLKN